jgi:glutathione S-transferase
MLTLHDYLPSQNGWKIRVVLGILRIAYRSRIVSIFEGESRTESFLTLNPAGAIQRWLRYLRHGYKWISARATT